MNCLRAAREARRALIEGMADADFRLLIVWTNTIATDGAAGAGSAAALFDDPRVHQFHDPERQVGRMFAPVIEMPSLREVAAARGLEPDSLAGTFQNGYVYGEAAVFDTMFFFAPDAEWGETLPKPDGWVTQLDPAMFLVNAERYRFGEAMGDEMARLADVLFENQAKERRAADAVGAQPVQGERVFASEGELALGDLVRFKDRFVAALREDAPGSSEGRVRLLASADGKSFEPLAQVEKAGNDLRDPRLSVTPDGQLLLLCEVSDTGTQGARRTLIAASSDGAAWTPLRQPEGVPTDSLLAGLAWRGRLGCTLATFEDPPGRSERRQGLFYSADGLAFQRRFELVLPSMALAGGIAPWGDDAFAALLADAEHPDRSFLVRAISDATQVRNISCGLAGAAPLPRPDGKFLAGARDGERGAARVTRFSFDGACERVLELPGTAGAGRVALLEHDGELWIACAADAEDGSGSALYVARAELAGL